MSRIIVPRSQRGFIINPFAYSVGGATDPNMRAGLHFDGADGSTTFTDVKGHTWTTFGCAIDTAQSKFGGASVEGTSASNYLESTSGDYTPGTTDWTIEFFHRPANVTGFRGLFDMRPNGTGTGVYITIYHNGADLFFFVNGANRITATGAMTLNTWKHIAVCKASGTTRMFLDGTQVGSSYADSNNYLNNRIRLMNFGDTTTGGVVGHMDDMRYGGDAKYTSNFTAPTLPFSDS